MRQPSPLVSGESQGVGPRDAAAAIVCTAGALLPLLAAIRARVTGLGWESLMEPQVTIPKVLVASYYDFALVAGVTILALALARVAQRFGRGDRAVAALHHGIAVVILVAALVNIVAVALLRRPLGYQWFYYSDFLQSNAASSAAEALLTGWSVGVFLLVLVTFYALRYALLRAWRGGRVTRGRMRRVALVGTLAAGVVYFVGAGIYISTRGKWRPGVLDNAVAAFVGSLSGGSRPVIFTMEPGVRPTDVLVQREREGAGSRRRSHTVEPQRSNVLVVVLESAGASYLDLYGGTDGIGTHLLDRRQDMRVFTSIYAPVPATNKAMVATLCSTYPLVSHQTLTREHPRLPLACLSDALKSEGYRTGYFGSSDLRFQRAEEFLAVRSFDVVEDFRARTCERPIIRRSTEEWPHSDVSDDGCTAESVAAWIEEDPGTPFFAMFWTAMSHFPYHGPEPLLDLDDDPFRNRYLNALHYADRVVEELLLRLEAAGLDESTLVVVMGDHGESFGEHGYYVHSSIYEQTARVPFLLIQPGRFHGEADDTVGGLVDVAPTVMDLLGMSPRGGWQGQSLWAPERSGRTYIFSPWSDYLFGYREGPHKHIFNATTGAFEVYDVVADPEETRNLSPQHPEAEQRALHRLAAWVQYQRALWARRIEAKALGGSGERSTR